MHKLFIKSTSIVVSLFFVICLVDTPTSNKNSADMIHVGAAVDSEHQVYTDADDDESITMFSMGGLLDGMDELDLGDGYSPEEPQDGGDDQKTPTDETDGTETDGTETDDTAAPEDKETEDKDAEDGDGENLEEAEPSDEDDDADIDENDEDEDENDLFSISEPLLEGSEGDIIAVLQERLMDLGFMEYAEPTRYFGGVTKMAVQLFQRQNNFDQDGIVTPEIFDMIMDLDTRLYLIKKGFEGEDVRRVQTRLYELGYITTQDHITGSFLDITEAAVKDMQRNNNLIVDGIIGQNTIDLLYSDEVKSKPIAENPEELLVFQNRLKELGYLTTTPDGIYGNDTINAIKAFQSRNDLVVDGNLGPSTSTKLLSSNAEPQGLSIGDRNESVQRVQKRLIKYGYLGASNDTGYFGELTQKAVKEFQKTNGLSADGVVGAKTMAALTGDNAVKASSTSSSSSSSQNGNSTQNNGSSQSNESSSSSGSSSSGGSESVSGSVSALIDVAMSKVGCKYVYGSKGPSTFDCSGFVYWCLNQVGVKQSYISSSGWRNMNKYVRVSNFNDIRPGDIVVVKGHVGIASYNGTVIDASSSSGKILHRELGDWWKQRFIVAWRIF